MNSDTAHEATKTSGLKSAGRRACGTYHHAILYPDRRTLARAVKRLLGAGWPLTGASDHGVSEAIYLDDPEGNDSEGILSA